MKFPFFDRLGQTTFIIEATLAFKSELKGPGSNCFLKHYNLYKNSRLKIKSSLAPFSPSLFDLSLSGRGLSIALRMYP